MVRTTGRGKPRRRGTRPPSPGTLVAVALTNFDGDVQGSGWTPINGGSSNEAVGVVILHIPNAAQRSGSETFTTQGAPTNGFNPLNEDTISGARVQIADKLVIDEDPSSQSTSATLSASEFNAGVIVAFKVAAGPAPEWPGPGRLRLFLGAPARGTSRRCPSTRRATTSTGCGPTPRTRAG